jgi:hypothetical protein
MGTMSKMVPQHVERFRREQIKLDTLTQPGWVKAAGYFDECDKKYSPFSLRVPAIVQSQRDIDAGAPALPTIGVVMESVGLSQEYRNGS